MFDNKELKGDEFIEQEYTAPQKSIVIEGGVKLSMGGQVLHEEARKKNVKGRASLSEYGRLGDPTKQQISS